MNENRIQVCITDAKGPLAMYFTPPLAWDITHVTKIAKTGLYSQVQCNVQKTITDHERSFAFLQKYYVSF